MSNAPMKLNHLSFPSHDPALTAAFFETYLGFAIAPSDGHWILKRPGFDVVIEDVDANVPQWPSSFHVGFELPSRSDVESLHAQMLADGVRMETGAPGGVMFELNTRADAAPAYRGTFD